MKVIFKNVGQGDSIILTWKVGTADKYGIIDCHRYNGGNPVVDHLELLSITEIEFIILSHPHKDHFSGMVGLLEYFEGKSIPINNFLVSIFPSTLFTNIMHVLDKTNAIGFLDTWNKISDLESSGIIRRFDFIHNNSTFSLSDIYKLICISPTKSETNNLFPATMKVREFFEEEGDSANWVSAVNIIINVEKEESILLTADAQFDTFNRLFADASYKEKIGKVKAAQIAHHGSKYNFSEFFWKDLPFGKEQICVISAGESMHNHPHFEVVKTLFEMGCDVRCTNLVNGMKDYYKKNAKEITKTKSYFSMFRSFNSSTFSSDITISL